MTPEMFLHRCPMLCHVGPIGAWEGIRRLGFRTASQLIADADLDDEDRSRLLTQPRRDSCRLIVHDMEVVLSLDPPCR